jgi:AGZA family xanthine/uracil permease-like MFS transporter
MLVVTFVVMLPILGMTKDPVQAWEAGLTWVFVQSFVLMIGCFIGPVVRRITPRAALLGSLAGISITFISMRPGLQVFETPLIGLVCFAIILANWFGGVRYFQGVPGGLVAIAVGTIIAWGSNIFSLGFGGLSIGAVGDVFSHFGFSFPIPAVDHVFSGFKFLGCDPGHRDSVRHLRSRRADGQRRERVGGWRLVPDHAGADRRRRDQPDRLPVGATP